jgi:type II secretory pathway pseudopilin PulG
MRRRHAFSLVELLVAMALIILIMSVLSQAFITATASVRDLKALGDLAERLRGAKAALVRDLSADHFEGRKRLSDPTFWNNGPPAEGFFRIWQGSPATLTGPNNFIEGTDLDGIPSYRSTDHMLHFAVKLRGNLRSDYFSASVPNGSPLLSPSLGLPDRRYQDSPNTYNSQWAEVEYFLRPVQDQTGNLDSANGTPLFALYRRQQLAVPDNSLVNPAVPSTPQSFADYLEVSTSPGANPLHFNSPLDLTMPSRRFGTSTASPQLNLAGFPAAVDPLLKRPTYATMAEQNANAQAADLLLTDVLSCDVRVLLVGGTDFVDLFDNSVQIFNNNTSPNPFYYSAKTPNLPAVFDTWSSVTDDTFNYGFDTALNAPAWSTPGTERTIPLYRTAAGQTITIKAIQITLRVWDFKTKQARQITIVQDM